MRGFPAFALCFLFLTLIWNGHYRFCRRYGLDDGPTRFLTCVMLFLVLFYVYPLKFLFNLSITSLFGAPIPATTGSRGGTLFIARHLRPGLCGGLSRDALSLPPRLPAAGRAPTLRARTIRYPLRIYRIIALVAIGLIARSLPGWNVHQWSGLIYISLFPILRTSACCIAGGARPAAAMAAR